MILPKGVICSICPQDDFGKPTNPYMSMLFRNPWGIPIRCRSLHLKQSCLEDIAPATLIILIANIIIAVRWILIKIFSAVIRIFSNRLTGWEEYLRMIRTYAGGYAVSQTFF